MQHADDSDIGTPVPYLALGDAVAYMESQDRALVLDMDTGNAIMEFTGTAFAIWRSALVAADFRQLVEDVSAEYGIAPASIERDCRLFIERLIAGRILAISATG